MPNPSGIEIAKLLRHARAVVTPLQYETIRNTLIGGSSGVIDRAVEGLSEEDEFILMCLLMKTSTHLAPLDQTASIAAGSAAPDLLARFQPGFFMKGLSASSHRGYQCLSKSNPRRRKIFL
jgi:hypothetical protein